MLCKHEVVGSIPSASTSYAVGLFCDASFFEGLARVVCSWKSEFRTSCFWRGVWVLFDRVDRNFLVRGLLGFWAPGFLLGGFQEFQENSCRVFSRFVPLVGQGGDIKV